MRTLAILRHEDPSGGEHKTVTVTDDLDAKLQEGTYDGWTLYESDGQTLMGVVDGKLVLWEPKPTDREEYSTVLRDKLNWFCGDVYSLAVFPGDGRPDLLPNGQSATAWHVARMIAAKFGGEVVTYSPESNPSAEYQGEDEAGHAFAVVGPEGRFVVDWASQASGSNEKFVWDRENEKDNILIEKFYGPSSKWQRTAVVPEPVVVFHAKTPDPSCASFDPADFVQVGTSVGRSLEHARSMSGGAADTGASRGIKMPRTGRGTQPGDVLEQGGMYYVVGSPGRFKPVAVHQVYDMAQELDTSVKAPAL